MFLTLTPIVPLDPITITHATVMTILVRILYRLENDIDSQRREESATVQRQITGGIKTIHHTKEENRH